MNRAIPKYFYSCFLLMLPIMLWNMLLAGKLPIPFQPEVFWKDIPPFVAYGENISRVIVFALTLLMPLQLNKDTQKSGLWIYLFGTFIYFWSWLPLIWFPQSQWNNRIIGFMGPALTPILWLTGIGLLGRSFFFGLPYRRWIFLVASILFCGFHIAHTYIVYCRLYGDLIF